MGSVHARGAPRSLNCRDSEAKRPHHAGVLSCARETAYSAAVAAALRLGSFSLMRADLPERSRR